MGFGPGCVCDWRFVRGLLCKKLLVWGLCQGASYRRLVFGQSFAQGGFGLMGLCQRASNGEVVVITTDFTLRKYNIAQTYHSSS